MQEAANSEQKSIYFNQNGRAKAEGDFARGSDEERRRKRVESERKGETYH